MDINQFKFVNDTYGHDTGDELLVEMAKRLRAAVPLGTLICRVGGDEFIVVLDRVTTTSAAVAAGNGFSTDCRQNRCNARMRRCDRRSAWASPVSGDGAETAEELLSQADLAMFEAKKNRLDECVAL